MGKKNQDLFTQGCGNFSGWERAICEAQKQIAEAQGKIKKLELAIQTFEDMRAKGEPFPGEEEAREESAA